MTCIPQIIIGNRTTDQDALLSYLREWGVNEVVWQSGVYETDNSRTNIGRAHKKCVRYAADHNWPMAVILEDDIQFLQPYQNFLSNIPLLPLDWDIFTSSFYLAKQREQDYQNIYRISGFSGLHLYAIAEKFYDTFLSAPEKENIDQWASQQGRSICFTCIPFCAYQSSGYSENVERVEDYGHLLGKTEAEHRASK